MTKYTKWAEPVTYGSSKFEVMTDEPHARPVAVVNTLDDARLIAAAPGMLAALEGLCGLAELRPGHLQEYKSAVSDARAAIAKATGSQP